MLNMPSQMSETITREAQDPVTRCIDIADEETRWGEQRVELLCFLSMWERVGTVGVLEGTQITVIDVVHPVTRQGIVHHGAEVLPCMFVVAQGRWVLAVPIPPNQ